MARTITVGQTFPSLRFYLQDDDGPVDLTTGVIGLQLQAIGPTEFTDTSMTADPGQTDPAPSDGLTGVGWCSITPDGALTAGRYAIKVKRTTSSGVDYFPSEGHETLDVEETRRAFATISDVQRRWMQELSSAQQDGVLWMLASATDLVLEAVDRDQAWAATVQVVPPVLRSICVEAVIRVLNNPQSVTQFNEQLGVYARGGQFMVQGPLATTGLMLTELEERRARRAVYGESSGTARARSSFNDVVVESGVLTVDQDAEDY